MSRSASQLEYSGEKGRPLSQVVAPLSDQPPDDAVHDRAGASKKSLALSERQFNQIGQNKNMFAIGVGDTVIQFWIDRVIVAVSSPELLTRCSGRETDIPW